MRNEQRAGRILRSKEKESKQHALRKIHNFIPGLGLITVPTDWLLIPTEDEESYLLSSVGESADDQG